MADSLKITFDAPRLSAALKEYAAVSGKDAAVVVESQGKKLTFDLYKAFLAEAATAEKIKADAAAQFASGRGLRTSFTAAENGSRRRAAVMAREIAWRISHIKLTAACWLQKRWRPSRAGGRRLVAIRPGLPSKAVVNTIGTRPFVLLENGTPGVVEQDSRHGLIARALAQRTGDMLVYIRRKHLQRAAQFSKKNPVFPKG